MKFHRTKISTAIALLALAALPGIELVRNDAEKTIDDLKDHLVKLRDSANAIYARCDAEQQREPTGEEQTEIDRIQADFESTDAAIARRERVQSMNARVAEPTGRRTTAELVDDATAGAAAAAAAAAAGGGGVARTAVRASLPAQPRNARERDSNGFRNMGEFLMAVKNGSARGGQVDPRLLVNAAPGSYGSEGTGADGGFAVPPDFRATIMAKVMGEDALLPMTDNQTTSSNGMTFPADETTPWQSSGGIQAYWDGEAGQKTSSKPALTLKTVKMNKVIALVPLTDELLEDGPAMASYVTRKAPEKITYKVNEAIIRGIGVGMPLGILQSAGTVVVAEEGSQTAATIVFANILKLWSSLTPVARRNAKWFIQPDVEQQLMGMQFPGTGTAVPVYLPPGGLSASPYGTLLGRPVMPQEACSVLGDKGDIIFGDLQNYLTVTKAGGIRTDTSIHIWFDYDITAFRFVLRVGGEPWWNSTIAAAQSGAAARGFFATLADRH